VQFIDSIMLRKTTALKSKPWIFLSIGLIEILFQINLHVAVELTSNIILCVRDSDVAVEFLGCSWNLDLNHSGGRKKKNIRCMLLDLLRKTDQGLKKKVA